MKSPSAESAFTAPIAAPLVLVGRIIEQIGNLRLRNGVGSGMIRLACVVSVAAPPSAGVKWRSKKVTVEPFPFGGGKSVTVNGLLAGGPFGFVFALPALSCQV